MIELLAWYATIVTLLAYYFGSYDDDFVTTGLLLFLGGIPFAATYSDSLTGALAVYSIGATMTLIAALFFIGEW